jgi:predicted ATPase
MLREHLKEGDTDIATWFRKAIEHAARIDARMLQLRAALGLCRVALGREDASQAKQALSAIYATFTEGFTTPDLKEAKALLEGVP